MSEELLVVVQRFCWTYNKFVFGKVNDNGFLVGIYRSYYNPRDSPKASLPCFIIGLFFGRAFFVDSIR